MRILPLLLIAGAMAPPIAAQGPGAVADRPASGFTYRGFRVDLSAAPAGPDRRALRQAIARQIDQVWAAPLQPRIARWLTSVPIRIEVGRGPSPGQYVPARNLVRLWLKPGDDRPLLLHELMHAVHNRLLPQANRNPAVLGFYRIARQRGLWPGSYMMSNPNEYFAVGASLMLHGTVDRPPHDRATLANAQPRYAAWLRQTLMR